MDYLKFAADNARRQFCWRHNDYVIARSKVCPLCAARRILTHLSESPTTPPEGVIVEQPDSSYAAYLKGEQPDPRD